jgi:hypothetical protein
MRPYRRLELPLVLPCQTLLDALHGLLCLFLNGFTVLDEKRKDQAYDFHRTSSSFVVIERMRFRVWISVET